MSTQKLVIAFCLAFLYTIVAQAEISLPPKQTRLAIFNAIAQEMKRLDAEALVVRENRTKSWQQMVSEIRKEVEKANSLADWALAHYRLDQAYPNLHSYSDFHETLQTALGPRLTPSVKFTAEWPKLNKVVFKISSIANSKEYRNDIQPLVGDALIAINGISIQRWTDKNFEFCKHPLKSQCDVQLPNNFVGKLIPLRKDQALSYTLKRGDQIWSIPVSIVEYKQISKDYNRYFCKNFPDRYPNFTLAYSGNRACIYIKDKDPSTAILRITSFAYRNLPETEKIRSVKDEINTLLPWWQKSANWDHLIIDVVNNGGGQSPIPYYQLLFQEEFQEQYFQVRKGAELLNSHLRKGIFWNSNGQEIWFQNILKSGLWDSTAEGDYLPHIPMFCANENIDCSIGKFQPYHHEFHGKVSVLLNEWCVSSCDGFVYEMEDSFGDRAKFYGAPQAADTAYSRLTIHAFLDNTKEEGFEIKISPIREEPNPTPVISQTVSVTRSLTKDGQVVSGVPVILDGFIPWTLNDNSISWTRKALAEALK